MRLAEDLPEGPFSGPVPLKDYIRWYFGLEWPASRPSTFTPPHRAGFFAAAGRMDEAMNVDRWTLYLAEVDSEPEPTFLEALPGAERLAGRLWFYPEALPPELAKRPVPYGQHPLYGKVYARPIASGEGLEALREHPAFADYLEGLLRAYANYLASGSLTKAEEVAARVRALGLGERLKEVAEGVEALQRTFALLRASGAPVSIREGKAVVGNPPAFAVENQEEAELVAKTYAWARREGVRILPMPRDGRGRIRFAAEVFPAPYGEGDALSLPLLRRPRGKGSFIFRLVRRKDGIAADPVGSLPPREVSLLFLPHAQG